MAYSNLQSDSARAFSTQHFFAILTIAVLVIALLPTSADAQRRYGTISQGQSIHGPSCLQVAWTGLTNTHGTGHDKYTFTETDTQCTATARNWSNAANDYILIGAWWAKLDCKAVPKSGPLYGVCMNEHVNVIKCDTCKTNQSIAGGDNANPANPNTKPYGNPVFPVHQLKSEHVVDFTTAGRQPLTLERHYGRKAQHRYGDKSRLGRGWRTNYDVRLKVLDDGSYVFVTLPDGRDISFANAVLHGGYKVLDFSAYKIRSTTYRGRGSLRPGDWETFEQVGDDYVLTLLDDTVYRFNSDQQLYEIEYRGGYKKTLAYDANGHNTSVTDIYGRQIVFAYGANGLLASATLPDGEVLDYTYNQAVSAPTNGTWPDQRDVSVLASVSQNGVSDSTITYHYENAAQFFRLTGITDQRGIRYATFEWDSEGRPIASEHAGGVERFEFTYDDNARRFTVKNPLGKIATHNYTVTTTGQTLVTKITGEASGQSPAMVTNYTYDANNYVSRVTDPEGNITDYVNDARGRPTSATYGVGTAEQLAHSFSYLADSALMTQRVRPNLTTNYTWDSAGRMLTREEVDTTAHTLPYATNGQARLWTYTYTPEGDVASVDGPLAGTSDTVTYTYTAEGYLASVTDEVGNSRTVTAHNDRGQPTSLLDENDIVTTIDYDVRGRVTKITVNPGHGNAAETEFTYDGVGLITRIDYPGSPFQIFTWDDARRLTSIENANTERREFDYNANSDVIAMRDYDDNGTLTVNQSFEFDDLGRLLKSIGAAGQETILDYDLNNNNTDLTDARGGAYAYGFDALNRLISESDPDAETTAIALRADGETDTVTDAEALATNYVRNGWGEVIREDSPARGITDYTYDARGLMTSKTDARGKVTSYAYDAAGRMTSETFDGGVVRNYGYDELNPAYSEGIGRLTSITDAAVSVSYNYNDYGTVAIETRTIDGPSGPQTYVLDYDYLEDGRLTNVTYPSGRLVKYSHDAHGPVSLIRTQVPGGALEKLFKQIKHQPIGFSGSGGMGGDYGLWSFRYGVFENGITVTADHDNDGRLTSLTAMLSGGVAIQDLDFSYDPNANITSITDNVDAARSQTFTYDALDRLISADGLYGAIDYAYDAVGNRTSLTRTGGTGASSLQSASYAYDALSKRLLSVAAGTTRTLTYTPAGQLSGDVNGPSGADLTHTYDDEGRLIETHDGAGTLIARYAYDAYGQRVLKETPSAAVHFIYDLFGRLIAEHNAHTGAVLREYAFLGLMPVAMVDHAGASPAIYYIHTDQVMRPQKMTDATGTVVWDRVATPFGVEVMVTGSLTQPLQFPGQIEDLETDLFQNWNREYDPMLGRYIQSDPIGLMGGINTYAYVRGNPVNAVDPTGLEAIAVGGSFSSSPGRIFSGSARFGGIGAAFAVAYFAGDFAGNALANNIQNRLEESLSHLAYDTYAYCPSNGKDPCAGLRRELESHQRKLRNYLTNPIAQDNKGILGLALAQRQFSRAGGIFGGRLKELNKQIRNFKKQLEECERQNGLR